MHAPRSDQTRMPAILVTAAMLLFCSIFLFLDLAESRPLRRFIFSTEQSLFEQVSIASWIVLGLLLLAVERRLNLTMPAASVLCFFAAAREADWHTHFTGYSVLKPGYYFDASFPPLQRLVVGLLVGLVAISLVVAIMGLVRRIGEKGLFQTSWGQLMLVASLTLVTAKLLDRVPGLFKSWAGSEAPPEVTFFMICCEEGLEMLVPIFLCAAGVSRIGARLRRERAAAARDDSDRGTRRSE
jgi:hypothetical protein